MKKNFLFELQQFLLRLLVTATDRDMGERWNRIKNDKQKK
jgi:hypothetical protein